MHGLEEYPASLKEVLDKLTSLFPDHAERAKIILCLFELAVFPAV